MLTFVLAGMETALHMGILAVPFLPCTEKRSIKGESVPNLAVVCPALCR